MGMDAEKLLGSLPRFNVLQGAAIASIAFICFRWAWQLFGITYIADIPQYLCKIPVNQSDIYNATQCNLVNVITNETTRCTEWEYDLDPHSSIIVEWDLVCSSEDLPVLEQTVYMAGQMAGAMFLAPLSDRFGRRPVLLAALSAHLCLSVVLAFSVDFYMFMAIRCVMGMLNQTVITCSYVLMAEWNSTRWRTLATNSNMMFWVLGIIAMPGIAYLATTWRILTFAYSTVPGLSVFLFYFILPESLFFLISHGRYKDVERLMDRVKWPKSADGSINDSGVKTMTMVRRASAIDLVALAKLKKEAKEAQKKAVRKLVTTPKMAIYALTLFWFSFSYSCAYYVTTIDTASLPGDKYVNMVLTGCIELPFVVTTMFVSVAAPRTVMIALLYAISSISLFTFSMIPHVTVLAFLGRGALAGAYVCQILYTTEMFATNVRNAGVGFYQVGENFGFLVGPLLPLLPWVESGFGSLYFTLSIIALLNVVIACIMPESKGYPLPELIEDVVNRPMFGLWRFITCSLEKKEDDQERKEKASETELPAITVKIQETEEKATEIELPAVTVKNPNEVHQFEDQDKENITEF